MPDVSGPRHFDVLRRQELLEELESLYGRRSGSGWRNYLRFCRKKYGWIVIVGGTKFVKRVVDVIVSIVVFFVLAPLMLSVAAAIKLTDGGPVLFWQTRVGMYGREFAFPKFRSMVVDSERLRKELLDKNVHGDGVTFKMKRDPRVTWIGRIIRKLSIDELPQLWCVLKGDMSLVGPRPPLPDEVRKYSLKDRRRLDVRPGLTCIWQVRGRGDIPFEEQVALDVEYINSRSIWRDFLLLLETIPAVLFGRGAY